MIPVQMLYTHYLKAKQSPRQPPTFSVKSNIPLEVRFCIPLQRSDWDRGCRKSQSCDKLRIPQACRRSFKACLLKLSNFLKRTKRHQNYSSIAETINLFQTTQRYPNLLRGE
ncbi:hypothetical protein NPIL_216761 [Nephila pilipes]|uniref:Uncharacterized protein n=1 Tax=Nephila pilipes TaxID=299642 RepID=A0A8X6P092_NEPPI|nr:hypothetical protein NPIL_216761 [Nephila pilipes]